MGLDIGYGRNDTDSLADAWRRRVTKAVPSEPGPDPLEDRRWSAEVIEKIREAVSTTTEKQVEVGNFRGGDLLTDRGEFYPTRDQLSGGAALVWDFCRQEGLHLFVGGDFKMSGRWTGPFEIIVRLYREYR